MEKYRFNEAVRSILEKSCVPIAVYQLIDGSPAVILLSQGFCDLFGHENMECAYRIMEEDVFEGIHPDDAERVKEVTARFSAVDDRKYDVVFRSKSRNNYEYTIIHSVGEHIFTESGIRLSVIWYTDEGSFAGSGDQGLTLTASLKNALHEESLVKATNFDHLTGLSSMTHFFETLSAKSGKEAEAVLYLDLCRMKYFNHTYGFAEGDKLLCSFSKLLSRYFGRENCSRLGQDHFAVVTETDTVEDKLTGLFEELRWINGGLSLSVHVGIYPLGSDDPGTGASCDRAKLACDSLSNTYESAYRFYDASMSESMMNRQYVIANFEKALSERWIKVYYQPIVRAVNGRVCDEEALARWIDPVKGFMSPADFIPALEDSGLIYKLDLYIVDRVLEKLKIQQEAGLHLVPQSVNLSRSDFDACDIVEEIRKRVDASGFGRDLITIEITESIIGRDFEFMKDKIRRFRELGFAVWMDDFGSGYSSLDVLKNIKFDLIKFDMSFLKNFDENENGRIILSELIKMATFLGLDTVCEGVETSTQTQFLRETGCSKLQGYYFEKPIPMEKILERYEKGLQIGFEDPAESKYFETVGRVNLHDLSVITQGSDSEFQKFFDTLPMTIIETCGDKVRVTRSNKSYRDFMRRFFGSENGWKTNYSYDTAQSSMPVLMDVVKRCNTEGGRSFVDINMPDGSMVHGFVRKLAENPKTETSATVVVVLSITDPGQGADYANIARALAADYFNIFYVNVKTEDFIEYSSDAGEETLAFERHGKDFFSEARKDALDYLYREDSTAFVRAFTKENILHAIDEQGAFTITYRLLMDEKPVYVNMKAMRMHGSPDHIIIGVSSVDAQMKQKELLSKIERDRLVYSRIAALSGDYICMYTVHPVTGKYYEYSSSDDYEGLGFAKSGDDFFAQAIEDGSKTIAPEDFDRYSKMFTKENVMSEIEKKGIFSMQYRLNIKGQPRPIILRAALVKEPDGDKLIVGVMGA